MKHSAILGIICIICLGVVVAIVSCGGGGSSSPQSSPYANCPAGMVPPAGVYPTLFVSAVTGSNATADGSCTKAYKTISAAIASYVSGSTIWAAPGTYNAALGEIFPIIIPAGVALLGDESNKGNGAVHTEIIGNGQLVGNVDATIEPLADATIAGFLLSAATASAPQFDMAIVVRSSNHVTIRNNHIVNCLEGGMYFVGGSQHVVTGNVVQNNSNFGIVFMDGSGLNTKVENNVITGNSTGLEIDAPSTGIDMGGGATGSVGGNTFSCNTYTDLWTNATGTIYAENNYWDHAPTTSADINNVGSVTTLITTGATVTTSPCL